MHSFDKKNVNIYRVYTVLFLRHQEILHMKQNVITFLQFGQSDMTTCRVWSKSIQLIQLHRHKRRQICKK